MFRLGFEKDAIKALHNFFSLKLSSAQLFLFSHRTKSFSRKTIDRKEMTEGFLENEQRKNATAVREILVQISQ